MKYLAIVVLVALAHYAAADGTEETKPAANQPAYQAAYQPYPYRSYSGYDTYRSRVTSLIPMIMLINITTIRLPDTLSIHTILQLITSVIICNHNRFLTEVRFPVFFEINEIVIGRIV
ncbi:hypothetical protein NPIL_309881 [Nephila pilipes]|uniref:Uncharacterized protein n=1 Tax=Nephila pilipes TaxID=299642 RepID=A0A8X6QM37_NEPPI|nr:hypothetical protein NPIL_309881 [Nephila pilipes]